MATEMIAVGGSASDPCHLGHQALASAVINGLFDEVRWVVSGTRPDKSFTESADHRIATAILTFPNEWHLDANTIFKIDLDHATGKDIPTIEYLAQLKKRKPRAEIFWFTGSDAVTPQEALGGKCPIEAYWVRGAELMEKWNFCIVQREGYPATSTLGLPKNFYVLNTDKPLLDISSSMVREKIRNGEPFEHLVTPRVATYIKNKNLYGQKEKVA